MGQARIPVAVLGATGYTGAELLRLLVRHPGVEVVFLSSEQYRGQKAAQVYPFLAGHLDRELDAPDPARAAQVAELVFTALPHGASAPVVKDLLARGKRVIDLSADFRLRDPQTYAQWYGQHPAPELLRDAVYGLPELYHDRIRTARLVAVPGCYPAAALLGLIPLGRAGLLGETVIIDAKSGTTGAGRGAKVEQLFAEVNENFRPYAIGSHRHEPEIAQELAGAGALAPPLFVPHLLPVSRGIVSTMYVRLGEKAPDLEEIYARAYRDEPFVYLRGEGPPPELREVRGTNRCVIGWRMHKPTGMLVVVSVLDNLGKGASGSAVQCMNLVLGLPEATGLESPALVP